MSQISFKQDLCHFCDKVLPTKKKRVNSSDLLKMERYMKEQPVFIVGRYFKYNDVTASTVKRLINKLIESGSISDL